MASIWEADIEKYPNLQSKTLPWFVGCAKEANVIQTEMAFQRFCPKNFKIINICWERSRNKPYCIWRVQYNLEGFTLLPEEVDELKTIFKIIEKHHPPNTGIVNIHHSRNAIIDYGVYCECDPPNFEEAVQKPEQLPGVTLLENVINMKITEEEKSMLGLI